MGSRGDQAKSSPLKASGEGLNVIDSELDLDFAVGSHAASIKKSREDRAGHRSSLKSCSGTRKDNFFHHPPQNNKFFY
jgi:hypothetical protein